MVIRRLSGRVVELSTVWVSANMRPRRNRRKGSTSAQKQDANERDCVKRLARVINCNFSHGDLLLTPKYDEAGMARLTAWAAQHQGEGQSWEDALLDAAEREGRNYMRRLGRALNRQGAELRYILITSDIDGETGEAVRLHHHIIIPRVGYLNGLIPSSGDVPWILLDSSYNELYDSAVWLQRKKMEVRSELAANDDNIWKGYERYGVGFNDWRGFAIGGVTGGSTL